MLKNLGNYKLLLCQYICTIQYHYKYAKKKHHIYILPLRHSNVYSKEIFKRETFPALNYEIQKMSFIPHTLLYIQLK